VAFAPRVVHTEHLVSSHVFDVERLDLVADGEPFSREVVRHRGAVATLAVDEDDEVVLIRQWRAPLARVIYEIPAGTCDVVGEDLEATAVRELEEEAGVRAARLEPLCDMWNSPGWSDQRTVIFLATELTDVPMRPSGPEEVAIEVVRVAFADALSLVTGEGTCDATTALALLALAARRAQ
jgi:8-oxo-dGTP pyrophosphatase MutT (NUDIX family)